MAGDTASARAMSQAALDRLEGRAALSRGPTAQTAGFFKAGSSLITGASSINELFD